MSHNVDDRIMKRRSFLGKQPIAKFLITLGCLIAVGLVILLPPAETPATGPKADAMPVSVVTVTPASQALTWTLSGIARSRWPTRVTANVSGRVTDLPEARLPGDRVAAGALLLGIDPTNYLEQEAAAAARVAQAELELARIQHEQTVARRINEQAKTPFARLEPHLRAARAELSAAEAALRSARTRLDDTRISAPFHALLLARQVNPGQWVSNGDPLFDLAAADEMDVTVEVTEKQWQRVHGSREALQIRVSASGGYTTSAAIRYIDPQRNPATRQRGLALAVPRIDTGGRPLLPESLVQVNMQSPPLPDIAHLSASALTADGQLWVVDEDNRLRREAIELIEERETIVVARFLEAPAAPRRLVRFPLSTMLEGQLVSPRNNDGSEP